MVKAFRALMAGFVLTVVASAANAQFLGTSGSFSSPGEPVGFDLNTQIMGLGFSSSNMIVSEGGFLQLMGAPATLTYEYIGYEAAYTNLFEVGDTPGGFFNNKTSMSPPDTIVSSFAGGVAPYQLNFWFKDTSDLLVAQNGGMHFGQIGYISDLNNANRWIIAFNDSFTGDADYDDMVVLVTAVPEPGTSAMLVAGLVMLGVMVRRRVGGRS